MKADPMRKEAKPKLPLVGKAPVLAKDKSGAVMKERTQCPDESGWCGLRRLAWPNERVRHDLVERARKASARPKRVEMLGILMKHLSWIALVFIHGVREERLTTRVNEPAPIPLGLELRCHRGAR